MFVITLLFCLFSAQICFAMPSLDYPPQVSMGRAFAVTLTDSAPFRGKIVWRDKNIPVVSMSDSQNNENLCRFTVLLSMPTDMKKGESHVFPLLMEINGEDQTVPVNALPVSWKEQKLTVEPRYVSPPKEVQQRIADENTRNAHRLSSMTPSRAFSLPLLRPVSGTVSNAFGGRRVFNNQPRSPHKGTDLRGATGTPVLAAADGVVIAAENQYFSGNVIFIDHGLGVITSYAHLSAFDVQPGDTIRRGQTIGRVGATGRVTGPHLHLGLYVQGTAVDAMPLFDPALPWVGGPTPDVPRQ